MSETRSARTIAWSIAGGLWALATACSNAGMGQAVRQDISARMATVQDPLSACYETALKEKRKLAGTLWLAIRIEPNTGKFGDVRIARSEIRHAALEGCVVQQVSALALTSPQTTAVSVEYPVSFTPR